MIDGYIAQKIKEFWQNPTTSLGRNADIQLLKEISDLKSLLKEAAEALEKMGGRMHLINGDMRSNCVYGPEHYKCPNHAIMQESKEVLSKIREKLAR